MILIEINLKVEYVSIKYINPDLAAQCSLRSAGDRLFTNKTGADSCPHYY